MFTNYLKWWDAHWYIAPAIIMIVLLIIKLYDKDEKR